jgi:hypothetical protein
VRRAAVVVLVLLATGCGEHARQVPPEAVAVVGNKPILRSALEAEIARARHNGPVTKAVRAAALAVLVDHARLELEAEAAHVSIDPAKVEARLREFKRSAFGGDETKYREQLRQTGMTDADVRADIRWQLLADALSGKQVQAPDVTYAPGYEP